MVDIVVGAWSAASWAATAHRTMVARPDVCGLCVRRHVLRGAQAPSRPQGTVRSRTPPSQELCSGVGGQVRAVGARCLRLWYIGHVVAAAPIFPCTTR
jgi:hypothetical protein